MNEQSETTETVSEKKYATLLDDFKSKVSGSTTTVKDGVVKTLVDREVEKRQNKIITALEKIQAAHKDLKKIQPDIESFDENHVAAAPRYTKAKNDERKKLKKQITELDTAINAALNDTNPDFSKLDKLLK